MAFRLLVLLKGLWMGPFAPLQLPSELCHICECNCDTATLQHNNDATLVLNHWQTIYSTLYVLRFSLLSTNAFENGTKSCNTKKYSALGAYNWNTICSAILYFADEFIVRLKIFLDNIIFSYIAYSCFRRKCNNLNQKP